MTRSWTYGLGCLLLACAVGCRSAPRDQPFSHQQRLKYVISDAEFEDLRFTISSRVFVHAIGETPAFDESGSGVIIAPMGIEGEVVDIGPDWLRVTFGLGNGVFFKTDASKDFDRYWLATKADGKDGLFTLKDHPDELLRVDGNTYDVLSGRDAFLVMNRESWEELVLTRTHVPGVK